MSLSEVPRKKVMQTRERDAKTLVWPYIYIFSQMKMETFEDALGKTESLDGSRLFGF